MEYSKVDSYYKLLLESSDETYQWNPRSNYRLNDIVKYRNILYKSLTNNNVNNNPINSRYWVQIL